MICLLDCTTLHHMARVESNQRWTTSVVSSLLCPHMRLT